MPDPVQPQFPMRRVALPDGDNPEDYRGKIVVYHGGETFMFDAMTVATGTEAKDRAAMQALHEWVRGFAGGWPPWKWRYLWWGLQQLAGWRNENDQSALALVIEIPETIEQLKEWCDGDADDRRA